jgi:flagellar assembly protein FliH
MSSSKQVKPFTGMEVRQWLPPEIGEPRKTQSQVTDVLQPPSLPTAAEIEKIQQEAYDEGFAEGRTAGQEAGHREGMAQAREALQAYTQVMDQLLSTLSEPMLQLDNQVENELLQLVIAIVRQLVRREIKSDPNLIIGVVREALSILPVASRNVRLVVHPEDAVRIKEVYSLADTEVGWDLVEDPVINRGGCKVITDSSQIDATLESRLASLIAPLLAGGRSRDDEQAEEGEQ